MLKIKNVLPKAGVALLVVAALVPLFNGSAHAASLSKVLVRFDRMGINQPTTGTVCATPSSAAVGTEASVKVTFPTGYTLGLPTAFTVNTTNSPATWPSGALPWPGIATATGVATQTVTFPSSDLTTVNEFCFNWSSTTAVTTASSASTTLNGSVATFNAVPTQLDTGNYTTNTIANDQVLVTASVPQAFTFALSANTDVLPTLSSGSISSSPTPRTVTINTNAANGWYVWARDSSPSTGLYSAAANYTIPSKTPGTISTLVAGSAEAFNMGVTETHGSGAAPVLDPAFASGGTTGRGGGLDGTLRSLGYAAGPASSEVLTLTNNATILGATPAATDYADTITIVGAGSF